MSDTRRRTPSLSMAGPFLIIEQPEMLVRSIGRSGPHTITCGRCKKYLDRTGQSEKALRPITVRCCKHCRRTVCQHSIASPHGGHSGNLVSYFCFNAPRGLEFGANATDKFVRREEE